MGTRTCRQPGSRSWARGVFAAGAMAWACVAAAAQDAYKASAGPWGVEIADETWRDAARDTGVEVRVYRPQARPAAPGAARSEQVKHPLVVLSHGMGGSRIGYEYLASHWASHGYLVVVPTHAGSDTAAVREALRAQIREVVKGTGPNPDGLGAGLPGLNGVMSENTSSPENLRGRPRDVSFVITRIQESERYGPMIDGSRIAVAGHSFGAYTAMAVAGMLVDLPEGDDVSFRDSRVKAAIAMSPQGRGVMGINAGAWEPVDVPALFFTGTADYGQGGFAAQWRRTPFESVHRADHYLVTITDGTHMTFADYPGTRSRPRAEAGRDHAIHLAMVKSVTTAFLDEYLMNSAEAREWLVGFSAAKSEAYAAEFRAGGAPEAGLVPRLGQ